MLISIFFLALEFLLVTSVFVFPRLPKQGPQIDGKQLPFFVKESFISSSKRLVEISTTGSSPDVLHRIRTYKVIT